MGMILTPPSTAVPAVQSRDGKSFMDFTPTYFKFFLDIVKILNNSGGLAGAVAATRRILTTAPLAGGGDLTADRTLSLTVPGATGDVLTNGGGGTLGHVTGLSVTITTAKLTTGGANGSMTFTNGVLTAQVAAT